MFGAPLSESPMRRLILLSLAIVGCGRADAPSRATYDRVGDAAAREALPLVQFEADASLCSRGAVTCDLPAGGGGVVAANGDVLVRAVGGRSSQVVLVRAGTDSAIAIGREGAGPGEYRAPVEIDLDDAGNAYVFDLFSRRIVKFAPDGSPAGQSVAELPPAPQPAMRFVNGTMTMLSAEDPTAKGDTLPIFFYEVQASGPAKRGTQLALRLKSYGLAALQPGRGPLQPQPQFAIGRDGSVAYTEGETAVIRLFAASGEELVRGGFDIRGREATQADIDAATERMTRGLSPAMRAQLMQQVSTAADRFPALTQLLAMADGEIWAKESPEADTDSVTWLVFSPVLEPRHRLRLAADDRPVGTASGRLLLARAGDDEASTGYWWMRRR
jgi:hypothetical protein